MVLLTPTLGTWHSYRSAEAFSVVGYRHGPPPGVKQKPSVFLPDRHYREVILTSFRHVSCFHTVESDRVNDTLN